MSTDILKLNGTLQGPNNQDLSLTASAGLTATSAGNNVILVSGAGGSTSGSSGAVTIQAGSTTDGSGGAISILGAQGTGTFNSGSSITITAGAAPSGGGIGSNPGQVSITGGIGGASGVAGNVTIAGGSAQNATSVQGGAVTIAGGFGGFGGGTGNGGNVTIIGQQGGNTSGNSGNVQIVTASIPGTGSSGFVSIGTGASAGTDKDCGIITIDAGRATGTGTTQILLKTPYVLTTGSSLQTSYDRELITSKSKALSTSSGTPTAFCIFAVATTNSGAGCVVDFSIEVADASNHVSTITASAVFSASNSGGSVTATANTAGPGNLAVSDTTTFTSLTTTWDTQVSGTNVSMRVTPTWAAGTPTSLKMTYIVRANGRTTLTPQ